MSWWFPAVYECRKSPTPAPPDTLRLTASGAIETGSPSNSQTEIDGLCYNRSVMIRSTHNGLTRRRFSRDDYYRMAEAGILTADARVELLDGEIVDMSPIGPRHSGILAMLTRFFVEQVGDRAICRVQSPLHLDEHSEPEPDLLLVLPRDDFYASAHPSPRDVVLLVELAESSIEKDRGQKLRLYAEAGIREYWLFDLNRRVLIAHRQPKDGEYASLQQYESDTRVAPEALPDVELAIGSLFE